MAAGRSIKRASIHVEEVHHYHQAPVRQAAEVDPPAEGLSSAPPFRLSPFVGRGEELAKLDAALADPGGVVVQAVHGLGGIGKSRLAARWADLHLSDHTVTWWITADSEQNLTAGLADLAQALEPGLAQSTPQGPAVAVEERAGWAAQWLAAHSGWLVVLDNVTHPADVGTLVTAAPGGRFLITSRLGEGWHTITPTLVWLDALPSANAAELLCCIAGADRPDADLTGAAELCDELGYLPLAIEQAAAYLHQTRITPSTYLDLLAARPAVMYDTTARGSDAERTIARIWRVTLDRLADTPLAGQLLRILAWYAAEDIPRTLLHDLADQGVVADALGNLAAYNMITLNDTKETVTVGVHRLVQAVARTPDSSDPHRQDSDITTARDQATRALRTALPPDPLDPTSWPIWRMLLAHVDALAHHTPANADTNTMAYLLSATGLFLEDQGAVRQSINYQQRALTDCERLLGADRPDTMISRDNLGLAYAAAGDLGRAIPLLEQALADQERVLGADHPDTLTSRNNLAVTRERAGDFGRAIPLHEKTLADQERVLGADHPDTLASRNNLAAAYRAAGDLGRAIPLLEQALADQERARGADHPETLRSRNNLAAAYQAAGDLKQAIPQFEQTLADQERVLGVDHPLTLRYRNNLAAAYEAAGDLKRAIPLFEQTLADQERVLGADHRDTLLSRNSLAVAYEAAGDLSRIIPLHKQTLAAFKRMLGADHPDTLLSSHNLGAAYRTVGELDRAIPLLEKTLAKRERVLGADHADTLRSRIALAVAYQEAGDLDRAIPLHEQTVAALKRVLGADHPDTLFSIHNLAVFYVMAGDRSRGIPLLEQAFADLMRVLGPNHPRTKVARLNLETSGR